MYRRKHVRVDGRQTIQEKKETETVVRRKSSSTGSLLARLFDDDDDDDSFCRFLFLFGVIGHQSIVMNMSLSVSSSRKQMRVSSFLFMEDWRLGLFVWKTMSVCCPLTLPARVDNWTRICDFRQLMLRRLECFAGISFPSDFGSESDSSTASSACDVNSLFWKWWSCSAWLVFRESEFFPFPERMFIEAKLETVSRVYGLTVWGM